VAAMEPHSSAVLTGPDSDGRRHRASGPRRVVSVAGSRVTDAGRERFSVLRPVPLRSMGHVRSSDSRTRCRTAKRSPTEAQVTGDLFWDEASCDVQVTSQMTVGRHGAAMEPYPWDAVPPAPGTTL
jgi:hypothetical protein